MSKALADAVISVLESPNELDRNGETANVVDGLFAIARAINRLAEAYENAHPHPAQPWPGLTMATLDRK